MVEAAGEQAAVQACSAVTGWRPRSARSSGPSGAPDVAVENVVDRLWQAEQCDNHCRGERVTTEAAFQLGRRSKQIRMVVPDPPVPQGLLHQAKAMSAM